MTTAFIQTMTPNIDTAIGFSTIANEFNDLMLAAGFVRTADTGQLDIGAISAGLTGNTTAAQPLMYRTNDALDPIYLRIRFGRGGYASTGGARIGASAGYSTNGAGDLLAAPSEVWTRHIIWTSQGSVRSSATTNSRACTVLGCYWVEYKSDWVIGASGAIPTSCATIVISRFCDANGTPNNSGFSLMFAGGCATGNATLAQVEPGYGSQVAAVGAVSGWYTPTASCIVPFGVGPGITANGEPQLWKHYTAQPRSVLNPFVLTRNVQAIAEGTEKQLLVGGQIRNYVALHATSFMRPGYATSEHHGLMLPWE